MTLRADIRLRRDGFQLDARFDANPGEPLTLVGPNGSGKSTVAAALAGALAIANPHVDILGHCTNRKLVGRGRPPSEFDAEIVFAACAQFDTAVEINCRPERQDPPEELLDLALQWECKVAINTDAHATGQMEWLPYGADKAVRCGVPIDDIVNTWTADDLLTWTAAHAES